MKNFDLIAGYENEKKEMKEICKVLQKINEVKTKGLHMPKGILLVGNTGVGKTVMAEAIIAESGLYFERMDFCGVRLGDLVDYMDAVFKSAIANAPSIVFMDELDKICGVVDRYGNSPNMETSRKILKVINDNNNEDVMLIGTINDLDMLHPALYRAGRFDRIIKMQMPNLEDRQSIIEYYAKGKQFDENVRFDTVAKMTVGFSGADIECVMNEAGLSAIANDRDAVFQEDIEKAINCILFRSCQDHNSLDKENKEIVAVHEAGHLVLGLLLDEDMVSSVSILSQGESFGHVTIGADNNKIITKNEKLNRAIIALGGKAAERSFYPFTEYTGSSSDIIKACSIVKELVCRDCCYGLKYQLKESGSSFNKELISSDRLKMIEEMQAKVLNECMKKAKELIYNNKDIVEVFVDKLMESYTLTREEILAIYNEARNK